MGIAASSPFTPSLQALGKRARHSKIAASNCGAISFGRDGDLEGQFDISVSEYSLSYIPVCAGNAADTGTSEKIQGTVVAGFLAWTPKGRL
jgi:hypothetical protein